VPVNDSLGLLVRVTNGYVIGLVQKASLAAVRCQNWIAVYFDVWHLGEGKNKAIMAVAHRLRAAYILLKREPYKDLGANYEAKVRSGCSSPLSQY